MDERDWLTERFEAHGPRLRAVAHRMLGSPADADDALQEAWLRLRRADPSGVDDMRAWLTTIVARVCLDMLRSRNARREDPLVPEVPDPVATGDTFDPEHEAQLADSLGLALLVVLETLAPAERVAYVLHDMFAMPFDDIAPVVGRTPAAARQLASRARRRVRGSEAVFEREGPDAARQRAAVGAFLAAARNGDFEALVAVLDPDVRLRVDRVAAGGAAGELRGASAVAGSALVHARRTLAAHLVLVNGAVGIVAITPGRPLVVMTFTTTMRGRITGIDVLADPGHVRHLDLAVLPD